MAEALWVEKNKGADGPRFIAERIADLALQGEAGGVTRWKAIASAYAQLREGNLQ